MKKFFYTLVALFVALTANAQKVTLDFTSNDAWHLPTSKTVDTNSFTNGNYTIKLTGSKDNGYNFQSSGYLILGKSGATLELPAFDFAVGKIEVYGTSGASASVKQNIFVGSTAVSTETTGAKATDEKPCNTYEIKADYQAVGNIYTFKVTSSHNTQITAIKIYEATGAPIKPAFSVNSGNFSSAQTVELSCETEGAEIHYTLDGTDPTATSTKYTGALTINETTTVKAVAVKNNILSDIATATYTLVTTQGQGTKENPYTLADVILLNNNGITAWVTGTIYGVYHNNAPTTSITDDDNSNLALNEGENIIPVALPYGNIRTALNLVDNSSLQGKTIKVYGTLTAYFSTTGVKDTSDYEIPSDPTAINAVETTTATANGKFVENGKVVILRNGKKYNAAGAQLK